MPIAPELLWRVFLVWLVIAATEVGQGILRIRFLNRRVGDRRARQIGVATGSALILVIAANLLESPPSSPQGCG